MPLAKGGSFQNVLYDHSNVLDTGFNVKAQETALKKIARKTIAAMERVLRQAPVLEGSDVDAIYRYLAKMPGFRRNPEEVVPIIESALRRKKGQGSPLSHAVNLGRPPPGRCSDNPVEK